MITTVDMATDLASNVPTHVASWGLDDSVACLASHIRACRAWRAESLQLDEDTLSQRDGAHGLQWMETHTTRRVRRLRAANRRAAVLALMGVRI